MRVSIPMILSVMLAAPLAWSQTVDRSERASLLSMINEARATQGLSPLAGDPRLDAVAEGHSLDMATHRFFSHTSPNSGSPGDRAAAAGLAFRSLAENIAMNQSVSAAHQALLQSPGHRANLLNGELRRVGLGIVRAPDGIYVTQLFATFGDEPAPAVPVAPAETPDEAPAEAPAAPAAPADLGNPAALLPQVFNALPGFFDLSRLGRAATPPARPGRRRHADALTVPTPFGAMRVHLPRELRGAWDAPDGELQRDDAEPAPAAPAAPSCGVRR
ncbi:MAG: CAP domain-containing protein [Polyangiales bacterium]